MKNLDRSVLTKISTNEAERIKFNAIRKAIHDRENRLRKRSYASTLKQAKEIQSLKNGSYTQSNSIYKVGKGVRRYFIGTHIEYLNR